MKTTELQRKAFIELFKAILTENGYYDGIREYLKEKDKRIHTFACDLYNHYDDIPNGMSAYYCLDSIEDNLLGIKQKQLINASDIISYLWDNGLWKY